MNFTYIKTQPEVFKLLKTTEKVELFYTVCNETEVGIINNSSNILHYVQHVIGNLTMVLEKNLKNYYKI